MVCHHLMENGFRIIKLIDWKQGCSMITNTVYESYGDLKEAKLKKHTYISKRYREFLT